MNSLRSMLVWDLRLQARYGFFTVYAILTLVFIVGLRAIDPGLRTEAAVLLIVTDPTVLGFYFIAAIVLFEKEDGVLDALVTSPLGDRGYLTSKVITLSLLAVLTSTLVAVIGHGYHPRLSILVAGVALSAALFVLIGFVAVARYDSINSYFISAVGWGTILFLPLAGYVGLFETPLYYLLPAQSVLLLIEGGFRPLETWQLLYAFSYLIVGNIVGFVTARRAFRRHIVRGGSSSRQLDRRVDADGQYQGETTWRSVRSPWVGLLLADLRNWIRDPMLAIAAVGPVSLAVVIRFGMPTVAELAAPVVRIQPFYPLITGAMVAFGPSIYGFVVGMFLLEDREQGMLVAYRTSPLSDRGYLFYRGATVYVLSMLATLPAIAVMGLVSVSPAVLVGGIIVGGLGGPVIAFVFGSLAANTIEGIALSKLINLAVFGPVVVIVIVPEPYQFAAGILPAYWAVKGVLSGITGASSWVWYLVIGVFTHLIAIAVLGRRFIQRVD